MQFRNDYEASKFDAEKLLREAEDVDELTVYRPAVICGDLRTGYACNYHGLHFYLLLIAILVPTRPTDRP